VECPRVQTAAYLQGLEVAFQPGRVVGFQLALEAGFQLALEAGFLRALVVGCQPAHALHEQHSAMAGIH